MKTGKILTILSFLLIYAGMAGCKEDIDTSGTVEFKTLTVKQAQKLVQGKWRVFWGCTVASGVLVWYNIESNNYTHEFIGANKVRYTNTDDGSVVDRKILLWRKSDNGIDIFVSIGDAVSTVVDFVPTNGDIATLEFTLNSLVNQDTLWMGAPYGSRGIVRVKK